METNFDELMAVTKGALAKIQGDVDSFAGAQKARMQEVVSKQGELQAELLAVQQKLIKRGAAVGAHDFAGPSLGSQVEAAFRERENVQMFGKTRGLTLEIKAAVTTTQTGGSHGSRDIPNAPAQMNTQQVSMLSAEPIDGLSVLHYARRTGVTGGAAAQDAEGVAKAAAEPVFTPITQNAITVAGFAVTSEQSLLAQGGLARAVDSHLKKSIRDAIDAILIAGTTATGWPFAGFVALANPFAGPATYLKLVDAILSGALRQRLQGFNPTIVVLAEADYLGVQLAKDSTGRYLADNYLRDLSLAVGGMGVALSAGVPAGKALLIDPAFCGLLAAPSTTVTLGYVNDQFTKNLVTIRGETQIIPYFSDYQSAELVTPALA